MVVIVTTVHPHMLMIIPVMVAVVIALGWRSDHASGVEHRDAHKKGADGEAYCVFHDCPQMVIFKFREAYPHALAGRMLQG
jgi:hypothetical protein